MKKWRNKGKKVGFRRNMRDFFKQRYKDIEWLRNSIDIIQVMSESIGSGVQVLYFIFMLVYFD